MVDLTLTALVALVLIRLLHQTAAWGAAVPLGRCLNYLGGAVGTPVHELSHALIAMLFGHRIDKVVLFRIIPGRRELGYVQHSWNRYSWFQASGNLPIGLAPLAGAFVSILMVTYWLQPQVFYYWQSASVLIREAGLLEPALLTQTVSRLSGDWGTDLLWALLCGSIGFHAFPSRADLSNSLMGVYTLGVPTLLICLLAGTDQVLPIVLALVSLLLTTLLLALAWGIPFALIVAMPRLVGGLFPSQRGVNAG